MNVSRRSFVSGLGAVGVASACRPSGPSMATPTPTTPSPTPSPPAPTTPAPTTPPAAGFEPTNPWDAPGTVDDTTFACGVQIGDVLPDAALVSVRAGEPTLTVVVAEGIDDGWVEVVRLADLVPVRGVVQGDVTGLKPDTTYSVVAYAPDGQRRSLSARFRTALGAGASRVIRFGATSCLGSPNAPWPSLSRIAPLKLDFFLLLGDTIYADEGLRPAGRWPEHWTDALSTAGLRDLTASTSVVATWDDHEVNNDWNWQDDGDLAPAALEAYRDGLPQRRGPDGASVWRSLSWGDAVELFVLDCRSERQGADYLSPAQLAWLQDGLSTSTARFKVVLNSVPITDLVDAYPGSDDVGWNGYPAQREALLARLDRDGVTGVLWVTGDVHWGTIARVGRPGTRDAGQWEVFCGPAGSTINLLALGVQEDAQFDAVFLQWNCVTFEADPDAGTIVVRVVGDAGTLLTRTLEL